MEPNTSSNQAYDTPVPPVTPSKFVRATFVAEKIKLGAKRMVGRDHDDDSLSDSDEDHEIFDDAAFNPQRVLEAYENDQGQDSLKDKLHRGAHSLGAVVKNPRRALRSRYARTIAGNLSGGPYEQKYDAELLDAHDALHAAVDNLKPADDVDLSQQRHADRHARRGSHGSNVAVHFSNANKEEVSTARDVGEAQARFQEVEERRDNLRIAWILGRHVKRIRVVKPMEHRPLKSEFTKRSSDGRKNNVQWDRYLAQLALWHTRSFTPYHIDDFDELPFDLRDLSLTIERLAAVSAPWQSFLAEVRNIYLWADPGRTSKFMALYWVLWYFQHIMTAVFAWVIVTTVMNRYSPSRIETIRKRAQRAQDNQARAQAWGELIQRHGKQDWIEPFLDEAGPMIQLELTDLSNLLEIVQSFYRWERPRRTMRTLFIFTMCLMISLITDIRFCAKLFWLAVGFIFFFSLPLAARHPKYRRLFNPIYWVFWDIPNLAEIAFTQLQAKAILKDAERLEKIQQSPSPSEYFSSSDEDSDGSRGEADNAAKKSREVDILQAIQEQDRMTFRAVDSGRRIRGQLTIQRHGMWYHNKKVKFYYPYSRLLEVRKVKLGTVNDQDTSRKARIARRIEESTSLEFLPSGIEFIFLPSEPQINGPSLPSKESERLLSEKEQLALTVSESDRHKIFSLVISWSNLKWQPQFTLNERQRLTHNSDHPAKEGKGNKHLDKTIKSFVQ